jgi:tRNA threonylcarbamoyladenosine biosynthesis protein TsaB
LPGLSQLTGLAAVPLTLALETSADVCAAAIVRDGACLAAHRVEMTRGHAEALVPIVQDLAAAAEIVLTDIDLVGVTKGPGSFTGLRTGIAAARGFALAAGAAAVGVSSLEVVARGVVRTHRPTAALLCVLETRREDFFAQLFDVAGEAQAPPAVLDRAEVLALIADTSPFIAGNAVERLLAGNDPIPRAFRRIPGDGCPDPVDIAELAEAIQNKVGLVSDTLTPLYLRAPEAKLPANGGRLKK